MGIATKDCATFVITNINVTNVVVPACLTLGRTRVYRGGVEYYERVTKVMSLTFLKVCISNISIQGMMQYDLKICSLVPLLGKM